MITSTLPCVHTKRCICCPNALTPEFCGASNQVLRRSKTSAAPQFCSAWSFAARQVFPAVLLNSFTTMADNTSIISLYLLWKRERRQNARRRLWVHETIRSRTELGEFHRLLQELRLDGERFQRYLRLTPAQFDDLLARIGARISRLDTNYRRSISASERLSICLRWVVS